MIGAEVTITNELAIAVGQLARQHQDSSVHIAYNDERPEQFWEVDFDNGAVTGRYIVNDETRGVTARPSTS